MVTLVHCWWTNEVNQSLWKIAVSPAKQQTQQFWSLVSSMADIRDGCVVCLFEGYQGRLEGLLSGFRIRVWTDRKALLLTVDTQSFVLSCLDLIKYKGIWYNASGQADAITF